MDARRDGRSATGADRSARQQAPPPTSRGRSRDGLADAEQVAFAVAEPGRALAGRGGAGVVAFDGGDSVGRMQARQVVFLEGDPASPKFGDGRIEVIDFPRHLGVFARWGAGGLEEGEFTASAAVAQTSGAFLDWLQAKLVGVEASSPLQVLRRESGRDGAAREA
jgi:hypothetical protein